MKIVWSNKLYLAFFQVKRLTRVYYYFFIYFFGGWLAYVCSICRSVHLHCVCVHGPDGLQGHRHECRACNPINKRRQIKLPRAAKRCISIKSSHDNMKKKIEGKSPSCVECTVSVKINALYRGWRFLLCDFSVINRN